MPPAKNKPAADDSRSDASTVRERQIAAAAHARKSKQATALLKENGHGKSALQELAMASTAEAGSSALEPGMAWSSAPNSLLDSYRLSHNLASPAAFTTPYRQALLTMPGGIGKFSPTMARKKEKRRVPKEQLVTAVRKHFNSAAVNELDVVVELAYKIKHKDKAFRMRSAPLAAKKT